MASDFFSRKLNLELVLNPIFYEPRQETKQIKYSRQVPEVTSKSSVQKICVRAKSVPASVLRTNLKLAERELTIDNGRKTRLGTGTSATVLPSPRRSKENKLNWIGLHKSKNLSPRKPGYESKYYDPSQDVQPEEDSPLVPEVLEYPEDECSQGPLEVFEPIYVKNPAWQYMKKQDVSESGKEDTQTKDSKSDAALQSTIRDSAQTKALQSTTRDSEQTKSLQSTTRDSEQTKALQSTTRDSEQTKSLQSTTRNSEQTKALQSTTRDSEQTKALQSKIRDSEQTKALQSKMRDSEQTIALKCAT